MIDEVIDPGELDGDESSAEGAIPPGIEIVVVSDEQGRGVHLTCAAGTSPADLIESALNIIQQVTRAALNNPGAASAGELELGEDIPW